MSARTFCCHLVIVTPKMKTLLVLVAVLACVLAEVPLYNLCDETSSNICEINEVRINPCKDKKACKFKKGSPASISFDFTPKFSASKLKTGLFWASDGGDVPFLELSDADGCQLTSCPVEAGKKQDLNYSLRLSKKLPNLDPCPDGPELCKIKREEPYTIAFDFTPEFDARTLKVALLSDPNNTTSFSRAVTQLHNGCEYTKCPIEKKTRNIMELDFEYYMKSEGKFPLQLRLWNDEDDSDMCCFIFDVNVFK
ncbi:unnamed protein product [Danaus chrysippus]|uniref:(African queen) hypothetical protein n=1 Tax=Danaus chrysippus TaxID=151541 RepID=A0A8J2W6X4_9NEOP|nr:unnamed protein product [Danaus chrysippus]